MNDLLAKLRRPLGFVIATAAAAFITATVTVWVNSRAESDSPPPEREPALLTVAQYNFSERPTSCGATSCGYLTQALGHPGGSRWLL